MLKFIKNIFDENKHQLGSFAPIINKINSLEAEYKKLSDKKLKDKTAEFKKRLENGETLSLIHISEPTRPY